MNRKAIICKGLLLLLIIFNLKINAQNVENNYKLKTVVIDAGHGGKDPGAVANKGKEKDITLAVSLKLGKYIENNCKDVKVIYTRKKDEFVELFKRAQIANTNNADLFICVHVNSSKKTDPYGTETYVMGLHKTQGNLDVAMTENSVITKEDNYQNQYDGFDPHSPEAFIIFSLFQNAYLDQSLNFAAKIQKQFSQKAKRLDRGVKQAGFLVLWKTAMPCILTEIGFLSNADEAQYLLNDTNQNQIALSIYNAFKEYKNELEGITESTEVIENTNVEVPINKTDTASNNLTLFPNYATNNTDSIYFYVQIMSSVKKINAKSEQFKGVKNICELNIDGCYKYTYGKSTAFSEILKIQKEIKTQFPDAFVIALKDGKKIQVNEAIKQTKN
ncbi:MAG: hypothetical protein A2X08_05970 [Bacteroidetes bacterium GWA2_32_17]|nr:MAG: hypothetical protein A2X08_05970 [Bacteroidetes bacterium GWA2_32_17]